MIQIGLLIASLPWVAGADLLVKTDVTSSTLTKNTSGSYYLGVEGDYEEGPAFFYSAQAEADADTSPTASNPWGAGPSRRTGYGGMPWSGSYAAWRYIWNVQLTIDLRSFTNSVYKSAWLEWPVDIAYEYSGPTYSPYRRIDFSRQLTLGATQVVYEVFAPTEWPTWHEYDVLGVVAKVWLVQANGYPKVYVSTQNYEVRPDSVNPDKVKALLGDPINLINGNVSLTATDISLSCPGFPLEFVRSYNSAFDYSGSLGPRWTHSLNWFITPTNTVFNGVTNHWRVVWTGTGDSWSYREIGAGVFDAQIENNTRLSMTNSKYILTFPASAEYTFNTNGELESIADKWNNIITLSYTNISSTNRLGRAIHSNGQFLNFEYQGGLLLGVGTSSTNYSVSFTYNGQSELTGIVTRTSSGVFPTAYLYDWSTNHSNHSLTQKVNAAGETYSWQYTEKEGKSTSQGVRTLVGSNAMDHSFAYSTNGLNCTTVTRARDGTNIVFEHWFDPILKRVTEVRGPNPSSTNWGDTGKAAQYRYDDSANEVGIVIYDNEKGTSLTVSNRFDSGHNLTNTATGYGAAPSNWYAFSWNTTDNVMTGMVDPEGCRADWTYDKGRLMSARVYPTPSQPAETVMSYTTNGLIESVTNATGHWIRFSYDSYGNVTSSIPQAGPSIGYEWSSLGVLEKIIMPGDKLDNEMPPNPLPRVTEFNSDEQGLLRQIVHPDASSEEFYYDAMRRLTNRIDIAGRSTRISYAMGGKPASITRYLAEGSSNQAVTTSFHYDQQLNTLVIRDPLDRAVEAYALDLQDRPVMVTNLEGQAMSINYELGGFVRSISRFDGTSVSNSFDGGGRLSETRYPDSTSRFGYLKNGLLATVSNEQGVVSNSYNGANRLTASVSAAPNGMVSYAHFPGGQLSNVVSVAGTVTYALDPADRLESMHTPSGAFEYSFNANNGLASGILCTNNGLKASISYDDMDRVTAIVWRDASNNVIRSFEYGFNNAGMIDSVKHEDGSRVDYLLDSLDRLRGETQRDAANAVIFDETLDFDLTGNRTTKTRDGLHVSYDLGVGNRLSGWSITATNLIVQCDVIGSSSEAIGAGNPFGQLWVSNAIAVKPTVLGTNFTALDFPVGLGTQKIVAAICDLAGNTTFVTSTVFMTVVTNAAYSYSGAGCMTGVVYRGPQYLRSMGFAWNGQYQLSETRTNGVSAERYGYDAQGRRAWTWNGAATNWHIYDGVQVVADVNVTGGLVRTYMWGPGIDNLMTMSVHTGATAVTYYAIKDHLGTVHALVNGSGSIVESYRFDAWGRVLGVYDASGKLLTESSVGNRYLWHGREYSWKTGLYYFRARWYDPVVGRFLSNDPIGISGGLNQYVFCGNDPVNKRDPLGLWAGWASGEPVSTGESFVPIWGSGRQAINDFYAGNYGWGTVNTVLAVSDVFLVKTIATGIGKGAWKLGSNSWRATRAWMAKTGRAEAGQQIHHWAIPQRRWGSLVPDAIKNQPWNLLPTESAAFHQSLHGWGTMSEAEILWHGTPGWFKALLISEYGRVANDLRDFENSGASNDCK